MRWLAALSFGCLCAQAQSPAAPGAEMLPQIRSKMLENLKAQPNYTCTETIQRLFRTHPKAKFILHDTVRLEVALVNGDELFASPGAKKFENTSLSELTGETGVISNGDFALHARAIFGSFGTEFEYKGVEDNRIRFDYRVPRSKSDFYLKHGEKTYLAAYHGSIHANQATMDVENIEVIADQIPPSLGMRATIKKLSFARTKIGEGSFLLPSESELTIVDTNGAENQNHVKFSRCRQFAGESVLSFDEPDTSKSSTPAAPARIAEVTLPVDLDLSLSLLDEIDPATAAVGDQVKARIAADAKLKSRVLIPKGATAIGRLTHAEQHSYSFVLGIEFQEIEWPGGHAVFHGDLTRVERMAGTLKIAMAPPVRQNEGLITLPPRQKLPRGQMMFWSTTP